MSHPLYFAYYFFTVYRNLKKIGKSNIHSPSKRLVFISSIIVYIKLNIFKGIYDHDWKYY